MFLHMETDIDSQTFLIDGLSSSNLDGGNIVNIPLIMGYIISIGGKSLEFWGHLGIISPFNFGPSSMQE